MKKPKLNVRLLKQILKHLREEPKRYDQGKWGKQVDPSNYGAPACGTTGCIAGWAVFLSVPQELWPSLFKGGAFASGLDNLYLNDSVATKAAQRLLGLEQDNEAAYALFSCDNQFHMQGPQGVKEAAAKINLLIRDRDKFIKEYR